MDRPTSPARVLSRLGLALSVSVLSGVLVAGLAAPVVGGLGMVAKSQAEDFLALPQELDTPTLAVRSQVLAADGSLLATFYRVNRVNVAFEAIPPTMRSAIIAIEDSRFYEHEGVDYKGVARAAVTNLKSGGVAQGASTLTQQYVKNALLEAATDEAGIDAAREQSADRKLREARYALALEKKISKDEILHRYLEIAYFGSGVYGVGTAATYFFNKPVEQLTLPESATLAGVVQNPNRFDLTSADPAVQEDLRGRREVVLTRMRDTGAITEQQRAEASATPLTPVNPARIGQDCGSDGVVAPFFCDYLRRELEETPVGAALGETKEERQNKLFAGGLTIRTTLDPRLQAAAQRAVDEQVPNGDPSRVGAVSDIVEPGTGAIKAMAVDRPYGDDVAAGETKVNLAVGGTQGFQPGSTFKVFYLASALQQGIPLSTQIDSPAKYRPEGRNGCPRLGDDGKPYEVGNAENDEAGTFDLRTGTHLSVNTFYMKLAERTSIEAPVALAEAMGVRKVADGGRGEAPLDRYCSTVLGAQPVSPLAMAGAYATFAARGVHCAPRAVLGITGPGGQELPVPAPDCKPVMEPGVADTVNSVLTGVIDGGSRGRTGSGASIGRPAAGKTGTTNSSTAAWFVGYTPQLSTAVWVGVLPKPQPMTNIQINGRSYRQVYGGTLPAAVWRQTMAEALRDVPVKSFAPADPRVVRGNGNTGRGRVPDVAGRSYETAAQILSDAGFTPVRGRAVNSRLAAGRITYTSPRAGRAANPGATVYVYPSNGRRPAAATPATRRPAAPPPAVAPVPQPVAPPVVPPAPPGVPQVPPPPAPAAAPTQ